MDGVDKATLPIPALMIVSATGKEEEVTFEPNPDGLCEFTYPWFLAVRDEVYSGDRIRTLLRKGLRVCVGIRFTIKGENGCLGFEVMEDIKSRELVRAKLIYQDIGG